MSLDRKLKSKGYEVVGFAEREDFDEIKNLFEKIRKEYKELAIMPSYEAREEEEWQTEEIGYIFYGKGLKNPSIERMVPVEVMGKSIKTYNSKLIDLND